jgi:hypothetical protein
MGVAARPVGEARGLSAGDLAAALHARGPGSGVKPRVRGRAQRALRRRGEYKERHGDARGARGRRADYRRHEGADVRGAALDTGRKTYRYMGPVCSDPLRTTGAATGRRLTRPVVQTNLVASRPIPRGYSRRRRN